MFCKLVGKVLKLWERFYHREKVVKVSKFQERFQNDNFKAGSGRKGKGKESFQSLPNLDTTNFSQNQKQPYTRTRCTLENETQKNVVVLEMKIFAVTQMKRSLVNIVVLRLVKRPFANIFIFFFGWQSLFKGWSLPFSSLFDKTDKPPMMPKAKKRWI